MSSTVSFSIGFRGLEPIIFTINLDTVLLSKVFRTFDFLVLFYCINKLNQ